MRQIEDCKEYEPDIKRVTKANSFVADGRVIYVVKKDYAGKTTKLFIAYDRASKVQLAAHWDKDVLIKYLQGKDMSILGKDEMSLF